MNDLKISYDNENGERIYKEYETIKDFINQIMSDNIDVPMMDYENVKAVFFNNPQLNTEYKSIEELYKECLKLR